MVITGLPGGSPVKDLPASAGDMGSASLTQEDPMCRGVTKPPHNYRACALEPGGAEITEARGP